MALFLIIALVVALYIRTVDYHYVIDDNVKRDGYMYEVPETGPHPSLWVNKPSRWYRLFMIGMHCVNVSIIYLLWGWAPALLFAVHPIGVWGTAWVTGNYYATTAYFCLISYYFLTTLPNAFGAAIAMAFYTAALNSTICGITFPFLFLFPFMGTPWGLTLFFPLAMYLRGKRFTTGIKIRLDFNKGKVVQAKFTWRRLILMTKVVARYIHICLFPERQGFFRSFGSGLQEYQEKYDRIHSANSEFWASLALCLTLFIGGLFINPVGTVWFFGIIMLHSQWNMTGQFFAERYAYLPIIGLCLIAGTVLQHYPIAMAAVVTYLAYKTHKFIPYWQNQEKLWEKDVESFPEHALAYNNFAQWFMNGTKHEPYIINRTAMLLQQAVMRAPNSWEIHMNLACFAVMYIRDYKEGLRETRIALDLIRKIGGGANEYSMQRLIEQEKKLIKKIQWEAKSFTPEGGRDNGKSTKKTTRILEPVGAGSDSIRAKRA